MTKEHRSLITNAAKRRPLQKGLEGALLSLYVRAEHSLKGAAVPETVGQKVTLFKNGDSIEAVQVLDNGTGYTVLLTQAGILQIGQLLGTTLPDNGPISTAKVW